MNPQPKTTQDAGLRKAAILLASLERAAAEAMLQQLHPEQARRLRQVMAGLDQIDPKERRRVIDEFFRVGVMVPRKQPPGIELDDRLARKLSVPRTRLLAEAPPATLPPDPRPFRFLHEAEAEKLVRVMAKERPQTIALVLSHLPPEQAGGVLARLPGALQADVIHRLLDLEETDPEILREVERALESRFSQQVRMQRRRVAGVTAITGILEAAEGRLGMQILENLGRYDQPLAERLSPQAVDFDDLVQLDDAALSSVFQVAEPELAMTALVGASPALIDRILRRLAPSEARTVRHKLDYPGPLRLSDVETARRHVTHVARRLSMEGRIQLPGQRRELETVS